MIISRKIKGMVMKNASSDNGRNQEKNSTRKKNHKQKDKTRDEIVKLMFERQVSGPVIAEASKARAPYPA